MIKSSLLLLSLLPIASVAQVNFGILNQAPSIGRGFIEGMEQGRRNAIEKQRFELEAERIRQETERIRLENEQRRQALEEAKKLRDLQAREEAARRNSEEEAARRNYEEGVARRAANEEILRKWRVAAEPRMHLHKDFAKIVYASDLSLTIPMIEVMAASTYAADLAYFLGSNKSTAREISLMNFDEMRKAIGKIESKIRDQELLAAQSEIQRLREALAQNEAVKAPNRSAKPLP